MTTSERIRSKSSDLASDKAFAALSHTVASCPARRNARDRDPSVLGSSSTISKRAFCIESGESLKSIQVSGQLDAKRCTTTRRAVHRDSSAVIAHHRLHDGQAEPGAVLLTRVIRSEQPFAFLGREAGAGVAHLQLDSAIVA